MVNNMSPTDPLVTAFMAEASAYLSSHPPPPPPPSASPSSSPTPNSDLSQPTHPHHPPHPLPLPTPKDVFSFAPSQPRLNDELLSLCLRGLKTGTTSWPVPNSNSNFNSFPNANPTSDSPPSLDLLPWSVNDYSVLLDSRRQPAGVMRTTSLVICRFRDVSEDFALSEAEGSREEYMQGHRGFYGRWVEEQRKQGEEVQEFNDDEWVLCERFEMVYPPTNPSP